MKNYEDIKNEILEGFRGKVALRDNEQSEDEKKNDVSLVDKYYDESELKEAYDRYSIINSNNLELWDDRYYEVAVDCNWLPMNAVAPVNDEENNIIYTLGIPSLMFFVMIFDVIGISELKRSRIWRLTRGIIEGDNLAQALSKTLRIYSLRMEASTDLKLQRFQMFAKSYEYLYMYKTGFSISEITSKENMVESGFGRSSRTMNMDTPPRRKINAELLEFYSMALDAVDPFTKYISYYHIIEYHFDAVYKKEIIEAMRRKLTDPDFSYKKDSCIYDLAKYANSKMKYSDDIGRGNELESLKYVLKEYINIQDLISGLNQINSNLIDYYANSKVTFAGSNVKISWNDLVGVYTNLAKRIYDTRNSLVHTKSEQNDKQYKPQKHKLLLMKEIPLIQVIAERIIISTSEML